MNYVNINGSGHYPISYAALDGELLVLTFPDAKPISFGDIEIVTESDKTVSVHEHYDTVYDRAGNTYWLSNDGSRKPDPKPEPDEPDEPTPTIEDRLRDLESSQTDQDDVLEYLLGVED